jgi:hypothetical protein
MVMATSPLERFQECGCGYVALALRWPQHFLVMFDLSQAPQDQEKHHTTGQNAFAVLQECIAAAQQSGHPGRRSVAFGVDGLVACPWHRQTGYQRKSSAQRPRHHRIYPQGIPGNLQRHEGRTVRLS